MVGLAPLDPPYDLIHVQIEKLIGPDCRPAAVARRATLR